MGCAKTSDYKVDLGLPQLCRRRIEYGLIPDPLSEISDEDLLSTIGVIRLSLPYSGVSMIWGSLRSRGVKVSRERVRTALQSVDPLSRALRWPAGLTRRQPYSVAGPNSLWHIGKYFYLRTILLLNVIEHEIKSITISKDTNGFLLSL